MLASMKLLTLTLGTSIFFSWSEQNIYVEVEWLMHLHTFHPSFIINFGKHSG
jgi:hypothetical protein